MRFVANMALVIYHLNSKEVYHRDLKPGNFLVHRTPEGKIFLHLSDFGVAKNVTDKERDPTTLGRTKGTLEYLAPEILASENVGYLIKKQDVWAIGVITY